MSEFDRRDYSLITVRTVRILELAVESSDLNIKWRSVTATFPSLIHKNAISLKSV